MTRAVAAAAARCSFRWCNNTLAALFTPNPPPPLNPDDGFARLLVVVGEGFCFYALELLHQQLCLIDFTLFSRLARVPNNSNDAL